MTHYLKHKSSFTIVVLRSLRHGACVSCGKPLRSFEESLKHWNKEIEKSEDSTVADENLQNQGSLL